MKPILIVRHGQAENNVNEEISGWSDPSLTEIGVKQSDVVAERLFREISRQDVVLYTSPLKRAYETAEIIGKLLNVSPVVDEGLVECQQPLTTPLTSLDTQRDTGKLSSVAKDCQIYPKIESIEETYYRAAASVSRIINDEERLVIIISHGCFLCKAIAWWVGIRVEDIQPNMFKLNNASISELRINEYNERILVRSNDISHLRKAFPHYY